MIISFQTIIVTLTNANCIIVDESFYVIREDLLSIFKPHCELKKVKAYILEEPQYIEKEIDYGLLGLFTGRMKNKLKADLTAVPYQYYRIQNREFLLSDVYDFLKTRIEETDTLYYSYQDKFAQKIGEAEGFKDFFLSLKRPVFPFLYFYLLINLDVDESVFKLTKFDDLVRVRLI